MREEKLSQVRETELLSEFILLSLGFTAAIGAYSISEEIAGFSPLLFCRGKSLCLLSLAIDCCACYSLR